MPNTAVDEIVTSRFVVKMLCGSRYAAWSWRVAVTSLGIPVTERLTEPLNASPERIETMTWSVDPVFVPNMILLGRSEIVNGVCANVWWNGEDDRR